MLDSTHPFLWPSRAISERERARACETDDIRKEPGFLISKFRKQSKYVLAVASFDGGGGSGVNGIETIFMK